MNQSEVGAVAILIKPEMAVVYCLTRKALDVARGFVDTVGVANCGSYAHLVSSNQRPALCTFTRKYLLYVYHWLWLSPRASQSTQVLVCCLGWRKTMAVMRLRS
jgi:hypothetical protein